MKLYLFTQDNCPMCYRVQRYVESKLTEDQQSKLSFVPLFTDNGEYTELANKLDQKASPILLVLSESDEILGEFLGYESIIEHLQATLDAYTYAHPE